jgi:DHA1 family inner membrane transport protein
VIGAGLLVLGGPWLAFGAAAAIQALSVLPLIGAPALTVADEAPGGAAETRLGTALMACEGVFAGGAFFVWQVALFEALDRSFSAYGGAMALAALAGAAVSLTVGRYIDAGRGRPVMVVGFAMIAALVVFRSLGQESAWVAVAANAMGALAFAFWTPMIGAALYDLAAATPCPLRYSVATETGWDLGSAGACLTGAAMLALGFGYAAAILIALLGACASFVLLWRRYGAEARAT